MEKKLIATLPAGDKVYKIDFFSVFVNFSSVSTRDFALVNVVLNDALSLFC
jgi:hypothetical protein